MDEQDRINETEEVEFEQEAETSAEAAPPVSDTSGDPYVSEDGAVMGRDFVIPGVDPREGDPYRFHTGRKRVRKAYDDLLRDGKR